MRVIPAILFLFFVVALVVAVQDFCPDDDYDADQEEEELDLDSYGIPVAGTAEHACVDRCERLVVS
jgi:hypothetical protein